LPEAITTLFIESSCHTWNLWLPNLVYLHEQDRRARHAAAAHVRLIMSTYPFRVRQVQDRLRYHSAVPVLLSSCLAVGLLAGRAYRGHSIAFGFLVWNLILAWIPYLSSLWADYLHARHPGRWWQLLLPGALWLAFFPNAPYIITDFWHLRERAPIPLWYDIGLLSAFALTGLFLAVYSLRTMQRLVRSYVGLFPSWLFAAAVLGLGGLGVYLGRFLRWNSWDLLLNPQSVWADVTARLADPLGHPQTFGVTILFAAILWVCYLALAPREPA
jgi:uncharacterized membrane protein